MAFYVVTKGHLSPFEFHYLDQTIPQFIEKTQIHGEKPKGENKTKVEKGRTEVFAINAMSKKLITLSPAARFSEAKKLMEKNRIHHIPIIIDHRLTGMISWNDLRDIQDHESELRLHSQMAKLVLCASEYTPLRHIAQVFVHENIHSLPIVSDDMCVSGIITNRDLLHWAISNNKFSL